MALPTKQQKAPRPIKFLQEGQDHAWDVHAIGQTFALVCATRGARRGSVTNDVVFTERRRSE